MKKSLTIFWILIGIFVVLIGSILIPFPMQIKRIIFPFNAVLAVSFFLLGVALIVFAVKEKVEKRLRRFLILTGASSAGFFVSVLLHNLVYGLFIALFGANFWNKIGGDEPVFFFIALFVCPILFLVGAIGSIVLFIREKKGYRK